MDWGIQGVDSELEGRATINIETIDRLVRDLFLRGCLCELSSLALTQVSS